MCQMKRTRIEHIFGWLKRIGLLRKLRHRGTSPVGRLLTFATPVYKLVRIRNLMEGFA